MHLCFALLDAKRGVLRTSIGSCPSTCLADLNYNLLFSYPQAILSLFTRSLLAALPFQLHWQARGDELVMLARIIRPKTYATLCRNVTNLSRTSTSLPIWPTFRQLEPGAHHQHQPQRLASGSSSTRWKARQGKDVFAREAKVAGLKSRAAFKLLEINERYHLFRKGDTVVDLGFAPGSWSQVAVNRTSPGGRVVGIDIIPAQPPRGVNGLQGNFLSAEIREEVRKFVSDPDRGRVRRKNITEEGVTEDELTSANQSLLELEKHAAEEKQLKEIPREGMTQKQLDLAEGRVVQVVLSDMSEPWPLVTSTWVRSVSNPYNRLMNTSGIITRDHGGSMVRPSLLSSC